MIYFFLLPYLKHLFTKMDLLNDNVCSYENSLDYMKAIMASVEKNQTRVRVLVEKMNSNGLMS